jgi:transposase
VSTKSHTLVGLERELDKELRVRDAKSAHQIADVLGVSVQTIARAIGRGVSAGRIVKHAGRPPLYTKASKPKA